MFPHMFVFFHICLHQISHLHRVDLSTFAVADLQGIRKGTWSMTAAQASGREALSCPGEPIPAQTPKAHGRVHQAENKDKSSIFLQASQKWPRAYLRSTTWMQRHRKAKLLIFTTGFFTHPSSFTQHMVTKEEFTSHFWDVFEEAMLILKEFGSSESPFWDGGERTDPTQGTLSLFREELTVTSAATGSAQLPCKQHLRFIWVTQKMWNRSHYLVNSYLWWHFSVIARMQSREKIQFSEVSVNCLDHKSVTSPHKTTFTCWSGLC